ncbi:hypothetical protein AOL_s00081g179 [Orbilia oligospora ATCC 24927]|uniref:F-box domain-containing protein n=1 Tax=Arthrobotrys oligospora (strain ATCC 24927 / CBS 115.81 / DSM 1491) TaxID=756982 RepID=G1XFN7_ARTOA|nr:hypothetical protein AOL_s00081g179 [Orbilia oligospora ATCC 24927]EGX48075.1 hypothetical protein AOL_s00081g179 [Orbilia oligospora ATCC 24927]
MTTLESLPVDIKFIILTSLPTVRSLKSLCRASSNYETVFVKHQSLVESSVYLTEALTRYSREALWLTQYYQQLHTHEDKLALPLKAILEYITYPESRSLLENFKSPEYAGWPVYSSTPSQFTDFAKVLSHDFNTPKVCDNIKIRKEDEKAIIKYHRTIVGIFQRFVKYELTRIAPDPPGSLEKYKIRNESDGYFLVSETEEERIIEGIYRFFVGLEISQNVPYEAVMSSISGLWGSWSVMAVRAIREFLLARIEKAGGHNEEMEIWDDDLGYYDDGVPEDRLSIPNLVLNFDFPDNIISWIDGKYDKNHLSRVQRILKTTGQSPLGPDSWDTIFAFFTQFDPWYNENPDRYTRDGKKMWLKSPKTGEINGTACLWDHWRLKIRRGNRSAGDVDEGNVAPEKILRYKNQSKRSRDTKERQAKNRGTKNSNAKGKIIRRRSPSDSGQREVWPIEPELEEEEEVEEYLQELQDFSV